VVDRAADLAPGDWAVLGVIGEGPTHGFAITQLLGAHGPLGRIWTLPRPMVYQALKKLTRRGLVRERSTQPSARGPARTIVAITPAGRRALRRWLLEPVEHVREVRSLLLLKLALLDRSDVDPRPLLAAQRERLLPQELERRRWCADAEGFEQVLAGWRLLSMQSVLKFLDLAEGLAKAQGAAGHR
jgi:DNA-binding PadR family transcriptional regulator